MSVTLAVALVAAWTVLHRSRRERTLAAAAIKVERTLPACRNLVITAEEIQRHPDRVNGWIAAQVHADAAAAIRDLPAADVVPALRVTGICAGMLLAAFAFLLVPVQRNNQKVAPPPAGAPGYQNPATPAPVTVTIRPPAYTGSEPTVVHNPERLEVLQGSRLTVGVSAGEPHRIRYGDTVLGEVSGDRTVDLIARDNGYFAVEDAHGRRRLIAVAVSADHLPVVRVDQPARDLLLPDSSRTIPVRLSASDDLGLQLLELRYTKVSGTGEQFEFVEGTIPVSVDRSSAREWRGGSKLTLETLGLEPGDSLVYRAVAKDARPGSEGLAASDTYFIEIAGPGQVALEGVDMPPDEDRYALSQQMIVVKMSACGRASGC